MVYTGNSRDDILDLFYCQRPDTLYFMTMKILFDRFVRVFVLRPPSGEVQQRQKLGERSLAGYVIKIARRYRTG